MHAAIAMYMYTAVIKFAKFDHNLSGMVLALLSVVVSLNGGGWSCLCGQNSLWLCTQNSWLPPLYKIRAFGILEQCVSDVALVT